MSELGYINSLIKMVYDDALAHSLQGYDKKRAAIMELGNIGDITVLPVLFDAVEDVLLRSAAITAIGKIKFSAENEADAMQAIDVLERVMDNCTEFQYEISRTALKNIAERMRGNNTVTNRIEDVLKKKNEKKDGEAINDAAEFRLIKKARDASKQEKGSSKLQNKEDRRLKY